MSKLLAAALLCAIATAVHATPLEDLAFSAQENNHDKVSGWVLERMVTLKLGDRCWAKILDKKNHGNALFASYARDIEAYARTVTGDDWAALEGQSANSPEANRAIVDKLVTEFAPKLHLTVIVDGDDCDASGNAMWLKYVSEALTSLETYPPKTGKAFVTIHVDPKVKTVRTVVGKDGSTFTITGAKDLEPSGWPSEVEGPMKRVSSKN